MGAIPTFPTNLNRIVMGTTKTTIMCEGTWNQPVLNILIEDPRLWDYYGSTEVEFRIFANPIYGNEYMGHVFAPGEIWETEKSPIIEDGRFYIIPRVYNTKGVQDLYLKK